MKLSLHKNMTNQEIADVLEFVAEILMFDKKNLFRAKAYSEAAETISHQDESLAEVFIREGEEKSKEIFDQIPGVGDSIVGKLIELFSTGDIKPFQKYVADFPAGMFALCQIRGLGAKRAYKLCKKFSLSDKNSVQELLKIAQAGKIRDLEGFGEKSEQDIIKMLSEYQYQQRMPLAEAQKIADEIVSELEKCPAITKIEVLGSLRRQHATIGDVDLGIVVKDLATVQEFVKSSPKVERVVAAGEGLLRLNLKTGHQIDVKISSPEEWGSFLQHFTGSKEHNIKLRKFALQQGLSLSEHGITYVKSGKIELFADEKEFYNRLGVAWIPPEKRIGGEEIEQNRL